MRWRNSRRMGVTGDGLASQVLKLIPPINAGIESCLHLYK